MERKRLLYLISSDPRVSPFDINMAYDAGFDAVLPYASVPPEAVPGLVQDVMFSRGGKGARFSALFFSGSKIDVAEAMLRSARKTLFPPFLVPLLVDPKGGYSTAASLWARVAALGRAKGIADPPRVLVAGGTGSVGRAVAALAAGAGGRVTLTSRRREAAEAAATEIASLFGAKVEPAAAPGEADLAGLAARHDIVLATGAAGARLLSRQSLASLKGIKIVADVNAVPPHGLEGVAPPDHGAEVAPGIFGIGAMAIGELKFKVESALLKELMTADPPPVLDLEAARRRAVELSEPR